MRRWATIALGLMMALVAMSYGIGLLLPRRHVAAVEGDVGRPPAEIAIRLRGVRDYPSWRSGVAVEQVADTAEATTYVEVADGDRISYRLTEPVRDRQFVATITDPQLPFGGTWTFTLTPHAAGTRIRIQEDGEIRDPVYRVFARFVFGYTSNMETYLRDLGATHLAPAPAP